MPKLRTIKALRKHACVEDFTDERSEGNGYWLHLGKHYHNEDGGKVIHEYNAKDLLRCANAAISTKNDVDFILVNLW